ncbi:hypothetical protein QQS21_011655 [Conoideocrella luteorostrata]|uniref:Acyl-CoA N-acyltransferase n=1 Tax=Conoideocrella luteorostrata TaxID=1105319 RepID=A0AAJ0CCY3_9HYPO|nr:hypothetical protein QQS21_011655 [Conoideocrella luteorostrata]
MPVLSTESATPGGLTLSKICEEMKIWISNPLLTSNEDVLVRSGSNSSESVDVVLGKEEHENSEPKKPVDVTAEQTENHEESAKSGLEIRHVAKQGPFGPSSTPPLNNVESTAGASGQGDLELTRVAEPGKSAKNINSGSSSEECKISQISVSTSSAVPLPAPLHIIQAAMGSSLALRNKRSESDCGWSVSSVCFTDDGTKHVALLPSLSIKEESNVSHNPEAPSKISDEADACLQNEAPAEDLKNDPVEAWMAKYMTSPTIIIPSDRLIDKSGAHCDIHPEKGKFLSPLSHPAIEKDTVYGPCRDYDDICWRQANMTADLHIQRELKCRENVFKALRITLDQEVHVLDVPAPSEEEEWPEAKCVIRPARASDLSAIADIVNAETSLKTSPQVFETNMVLLEDVEKIWDLCRVTSRPFIVVTPAEVDVLDKTKWPEGSDNIYQKFARYIADNPLPAPPVVGFAYITDSRLNTGGHLRLESRYSGSLRIFVHPEHRRNLYGSALVDRIMLSISPFYTSRLDHGWQCDQPDGVYEFPASHNSRQYAQIYVEMFNTRKYEKSREWKTEFLQKWGFKKVGFFANVVVSEDDQHHLHWLDVAIWECPITPISKIVNKSRSAS